MGGEWRQSTWGEEITLEYGKRIKDYKETNAPYRVYGSNGPVGWTQEPIVDGPGVILGRKGAYRGVEYSPHPFSVIDTAYWVKPNRDLDMRWLYYAVNHYELGKIDDGSPIPSTTRSAVYVRELLVPPIIEQRAIAHILGTLDDKIELNRQMNRTLEAMAQALFKSWFIDFDPVVVNALHAGNPVPEKFAQRAAHYRDNPNALRLPEETLRLFPDRFQDSELGPIPEGWKAGILSDIAESPRRGIKPTDVAESTPYIGLEHMPRGSIALSDWGMAGKVTSSKFKFQKGEFLFGKLRPYFHKVGVAAIDGICSTDIIVITPKSEEWGALTLAYISSDSFVEYTNSGATGTRMPRTNWKIMAAYSIRIPSQVAAQAYQALVMPMIDKIIENIHKSRTLEGLRDTLLPKLISGELRVPNAEKLLEKT